MDEKRIERKEAIDLKLDELYMEKWKINSQIMPLIEERHKIIQFYSWAHNYSENVLISKMDLYDEMARMYYGFMDYCKTTGIPKSSKQYQVAKCKYRTAIVNLESVIDRISWIDSKYYRKEF